MSGLLTLNAGSSSLKFALFCPDGDVPVPILRGQIANILTAPAFSARSSEGSDLPPGPLADLAPGIAAPALVAPLFDWLAGQGGGLGIAAVGHRVVHGGDAFAAPVRLTGDTLDRLAALIPLAPLHQPQNLDAIAAVAQHRPDVPQVACFDTAFHQTMPRLHRLFALPRALSESGIRRYGFHGLSYAHIARALPDAMGDRARGRVVVAHLGSGASLCAMRGGRSVATTMGFTALDGLVMGRRCGTLDPGVILHLIEERGMRVADVSRMLYNDSGLLGVSGLSSDMGALLADPSPPAQEAVDLFCHRAAAGCAALAVALGGLDAIVFTAGIGENAPEVRRRICAQLGWLGATLDDEANARGVGCISVKDAAIAVQVMATDEEAEIARGTLAALA